MSTCLVLSVIIILELDPIDIRDSTTRQSLKEIALTWSTVVLRVFASRHENVCFNLCWIILSCSAVDMICALRLKFQAFKGELVLKIPKQLRASRGEKLFWQHSMKAYTLDVFVIYLNSVSITLVSLMDVTLSSFQKDIRKHFHRRIPGGRKFGWFSNRTTSRGWQSITYGDKATSSGAFALLFSHFHQ